MNEKVVAFGEILMRLSPHDFLRFTQARFFEVIYGGAEANVAIALANFGVSVELVTRLPSNSIGDACLNYLRQYGLRMPRVIRGEERLGIYFLEKGAVQRRSEVIYDRADSSFAAISPGMIKWKKVFSGACWFHYTGITPAVSQGAAETCLEAVRTAKELGLTVSCDLNYRTKLWKWGKTAGEVMSELVKYTDIVMCNEEDAERVFGISAGDAFAGKIDAKKYRSVAKKLMEKFSNLKKVAVSLRTSLSASHNIWSGVLYDGKAFYTAPTYDITHIVDRVGGGDAFAAGLIYGFLKFGSDNQRVLNFAVAASCLKHTIFGDSNLVSVKEVNNLMSGMSSGRISR